LGEELGLEIFPNPTSDILFLKIKTTDSFTFQLFNSLGQPVRQFEMTGQHELDVNDLPAGIYWLGSQGRFLGKILVSE